MDRQTEIKALMNWVQNHEQLSDSSKEIMLNTLEKQIPRLPKTHYGRHTRDRFGRLVSFNCPSCGRFIIACYENDPALGGGISPELNGCYKCLQALDFSAWKVDETLKPQIKETKTPGKKKHPKREGDKL